MARIAIMLAEGFEEVEAVTPTDFLRRAGAEVFVVGIESSAPRGSNGIKIETDILLKNLDGELDGIVLPGGMPGAANLAESEILKDLCFKVLAHGGLLAAICAAPAVALGAWGILDEKKFTCYPGFEEKVGNGHFSPSKVVRDGNLITSRGPGTAGEFSIELIRYFYGDEEAANRAKAGLIAM